ncbi:MAG: hypothetical protein COA78_30925 [Blastopirellula sp.]|nr:MAG: hypothetical protein COA78_30925 [Blastopirellula sp.]
MSYRSSLSLLLVAFISLSLQADTLELLNGDRISGEVVGLDSKEIQLKSESFGVLKIPRSKVAAIYLGNRLPAKTRSTNGTRPVTRPSANSSNRSTPVPIKDPFAVESVEQAIRNAGVNPGSIGKAPGVPGGKRPGSANSKANGNAKNGATAGASKTRVNPPRGSANVVDQLQTNGVDPETRKQLEALFPLMSQPGVKGYFDKTVGGLSSGKVDILQVRKDAIKARDEFTQMQKQLGPSVGGALAPYLTILNKFIDETAPQAAKAAKAAKQSGAAKTPAKKLPATKIP